jgi:aryl-alcohol dehydrogenase-like predicted oxidoreductase
MKLPELILGTAMWGWTVEARTCFSILSAFYEKGGRQVDTATNYPINKDPEAFRRAENILLEWIQTHQVQDLQVTVKVGSINNLFTPENNLTQSFLLMNLDYYKYAFRENLHTLMIHWDNREDADQIQDSLEALRIAYAAGYQPGLSGIRRPDIYAKLNEEFRLPFRIQIKHNPLQSAYAHYAPFHGRRCFSAYGITAGGFKLDGKYEADSSLKARGKAPEVEDERQEMFRKLLEKANRQTGRTPISNFHQLGLIHAAFAPDMEGILIGPSRLEQLDSTFAFYEQLKDGAYQDVYQALANIHDH